MLLACALTCCRFRWSIGGSQAVVEAAMKFQEQGFVLPPPWDEDLQKEDRLMEDLTNDKQCAGRHTKLLSPATNCNT